MIGWLFAAAAQLATAAPPLPAAPPIASLRAVDAPDAYVDVTLDGVRQRLRLVPGADSSAALIGRTPDGEIALVLPVADVGAALALLTDRRFAPLAPGLLAWAGPDLTRLRDRNIAVATAAADQAINAPRSTIESAARPALAARFRLSATLAAAGRFDDALAAVAAAGPRNPAKGTRERLEYALVAIRLANLEHAAGRSAAAIARLRAAAAAMKPGDVYAINLGVNLAAILVETGSAAEALALADGLRKRLPPDAIAGSDRHFAWIRACALTKLGRIAEAAAERPRFLHGAQPRDRDFVAAGNDDVARRGLTCMGDAAGLAARLAAQATRPFTATATLWLQPGFLPETATPEFVAAVANDPGLRAAMAGRVVVLGPEFAPALRGWR